MRLIVTINTDNAAFADGALGTELARILRDLADRAANATEPSGAGPLYDCSRNRVGGYHFDEGEV